MPKDNDGAEKTEPVMEAFDRLEKRIRELKDEIEILTKTVRKLKMSLIDMGEATNKMLDEIEDAMEAAEDEEEEEDEEE